MDHAGGRCARVTTGPAAPRASAWAKQESQHEQDCHRAAHGEQSLPGTRAHDTLADYDAGQQHPHGVANRARSLDTCKGAGVAVVEMAITTAAEDNPGVTGRRD
jgi:hypothetical protein